MTVSAFRGVDPGPWVHRVRITEKATGGTTDPLTGKFIPSGADVEIIADTGEPNADVQDGRKVIERNEDNTPRVTAEAVIYLRDETKIAAIREGMTGTVTGEEYAGEDFEVVGSQRLDGAVFVNWL